MQVIANGKRIIGEQSDADVFETQVYSMYAQSQENRKDIVNQGGRGIKENQGVRVLEKNS